MPQLKVKALPEYAVWRSMKQRCLNPWDPSFRHYGGRGIAVSVSWARSFKRFYEDMGPRPSPRHTLDRRDNDGPYSVANCRWATWSEQKLNSTSGPKRFELVGIRFGRLVALSAEPKRPRRMTYWRCRCDCGREVSVGIGHLRSGHTQSCGCLQRERTAASNRERVA